MNNTRRTLCALSLLSAGSACDPPNHADGGGIDRVVVDTSPPTTADVAIDRDASSTADCGMLTTDAGISSPPMAGVCCPDPQAHVDCFGGASCRGATVIALLHAPVYACSHERAQQWLRENVCEQLGVPIGTCPGSTRCEFLEGEARLSDARYPMCEAIPPPNRPFPSRFGRGQVEAFWRLACSDRGPSVGSACTGDEHCRPAPATVNGQLRCVSGQCAEVPRPARAARFGESCVPSARPVGGSATCETCVTPVDGCGAFCSQPCLFDEDCPDAFVCAYAGRTCGGACVPAGHRAALLGGPEPADAGAPSVAAPYPNCVDGGAATDASMDADASAR